MTFHPIADIFPLMTGDEYQALVTDIATHGLYEPLWLYEGQILDGRNRWNACVELGIEPEVHEYTGNAPLAFVVSMNLHRRHLTREQRDEVLRQLRAQGMTLQKIADAVGVSVGTAHNVAGDVIFNSEIENIRGQIRPAHYLPRQIDEEDEHDEYDFNREQIIEANRQGACIIVPEKLPPHVAYNAGNNEWYTPTDYIRRVVAVMGGIDLDPASNETANTVVGAVHFYTAEDNGLAQEWSGRVFMNPPYASELIGKFVDKLLASPDVTEAIVLVNNATETRWFQLLAQSASAICFPAGRVRFWSPEKESFPLQGQAVLYLGTNIGRFIEYFSDLGTVWRK